jgi:hypothetical protein
MFFIFLKKSFVWVILLIVSAALAQSTQGGPFLYNKVIQQSISCSGGHYPISLTLNYRFTGNYVGNSFYLDTVQISNIPSACSGKVFSITGFGSDKSKPLSLAGDCFYSPTEGISAGQRVDVYFSGTKVWDQKKANSISGQPPKSTYSWKFAGSQISPKAGVAAQLIDSFAYPVTVDSHSFTIKWISGSDPATFCSGTNYTNTYISVPLAFTLEKIDVSTRDLQPASRTELIKDGII